MSGGNLSRDSNQESEAASGLLEGLFPAEDATPGVRAAATNAAKVLLMVAFCGLVVTLVISIWLHWNAVAVVCLLPLIAVAVAFRLVRKQQVQAAVCISFLAIVGFISYSSYDARGIYNAGLSVLPMLITIAGLWLRRALLVAITAATIASVIALASLRWFNGRDDFNPDMAGDLVLLAMTFCVAAVCGRLLSRHVESSFQRIRDSEARYRRIFGNIKDVYFEMRPGGVLLELSPEAANLLGLPREGLIGRPLADYCPDSAAYDALLREIRARGRVANVELTLSRDGGPARTVLVSATLQQGVDEGGDRIVGSIRDITERRALEENLAQARKMESIGALAGGIAHDFNNLLTVINGHSELVQRRIADGRDPSQDIEAIRAAGERAAELTRQLLAFSRKETYAPRVVNVVSVLERLAPVIRTLAGEDLAVEFDLAPDTPRVLADPGQIEQVLINLVANARDAIHQAAGWAGAKVIRVSTRLSEMDSPALPGLNPGRYLMLSVTDSGPGIPPEIRAKIFEPFFSTKRAGTGLGLATVYGIVRQNGGAVNVESGPGLGASFVIHWPATGRPAEDQVETKPLTANGDERILLVEDDASVRRFASSALAEHGFRVIEAANGREALELMREYNGDVGMVVTDVVMPEMDGKQLAVKLKERFNGVKVLFVSGYAEDHLSHGGALDAGVSFLKKPYTAGELALKVRTLLDEA